MTCLYLYKAHTYTHSLTGRPRRLQRSRLPMTTLRNQPHLSAGVNQLAGSHAERLSMGQEEIREVLLAHQCPAPKRLLQGVQYMVRGWEVWVWVRTR